MLPISSEDTLMYFDREEKGSTERICNEVAESSLCSPAGPKALTVFSCQREERSKVPGLILRQSSGKMIKYKKDKRRKKIMTERISNVLRATNSNASPSVPAPYTCASAEARAIPSDLTQRRLLRYPVLVF